MAMPDTATRCVLILTGHTRFANKQIEQIYDVSETDLVRGLADTELCFFQLFQDQCIGLACNDDETGIVHGGSKSAV